MIIISPTNIFVPNTRHMIPAVFPPLCSVCSKNFVALQPLFFIPRLITHVACVISLKHVKDRWRIPNLSSLFSLRLPVCLQVLVAEPPLCRSVPFFPSNSLTQPVSSSPASSLFSWNPFFVSEWSPKPGWRAFSSSSPFWPLHQWPLPTGVNLLLLSSPFK